MTTRYLIRRTVGEGGLGRVWAVRDTVLNRTVALKELRPDRALSDAASQDFLREAQITGQLEHPNIVSLYDLGRRPQDNQPFYTMPFVKGETLSNAIENYHRTRREGSRDRMQFVRLINAFVSICNAIAYAHSRNVIHRDLKPENIILGPFGEVILLDWGLARLNGDQHTESDDSSIHLTTDSSCKILEGRPEGTPAYMAPEQAEGRSSLIGPRTDIYGLGTILFQILTGIPPHSGKDLSDLYNRIIHNPTPQARLVEPSASKVLSVICAKAMAKAPEDRYSLASELADDVSKWTGDEPVSAYEESILEKAARWARRNRTLTQAIVGSLAAVAVVSLFAWILVSRAKDAAVDAEKIAQAARKEATERLRQARSAADTLLTGVSKDLKEIPGAEVVRTLLLKKAAEFYEGFSKNQGQDPELKLEAGLALNRLGEVHRSLGMFKESWESYKSATNYFKEVEDKVTEKKAAVLGRCESLIGIGLTQREATKYEESEQAYNEAIEELKKLEKIDPSNLVTLDRLAFAETSLGVLLEEQNNKLAETQYVNALKRYDEMIKREPKAYLSDRARAHVNLGTYHYNKGISYPDEEQEKIGQLAYLEAKAHYLAARDDLIRLDLKNPEYLERYARCQTNLGLVLGRLKQDEDSRRSLEAAIRSFEKLIYASVPQYARGLADARVSLAEAINNKNLAISADAISATKKAIEEFEQLNKANPEKSDYEGDLATAYHFIGSVLMKSENPSELELKESLTYLDKALFHRQLLFKNKSNYKKFRDDLLKSLSLRAFARRKLNQVTGTIEDARQLSEISRISESGVDLFNAGSYLAWAAGRKLTDHPEESKKLCDEAILLLEEAWKIDPGLAENLFFDKDLDPLAHFPRFQALAPYNLASPPATLGSSHIFRDFKP